MQTTVSETWVTPQMKRVVVTGTSKAAILKMARMSGLKGAVSFLSLRDDNGLPCYAKVFGRAGSQRDVPVYYVEGYARDA